MKAAVARTRNKGYYRVLHVPIWIYVFFTLPGMLTAALYAHGFSLRHWIWLALVAAVCIWRGAVGRLPGAEPRPYITHYGLDWPNLGYRIACYTAAWIAIIAPWLLNLIGLIVASVSGRWIIQQLYGWPYDLIAVLIVLVAALNCLPRARSTVRNEGAERAWFYIGVWTAIVSQLAAWAMWRLGPAMGFSPAQLLWARLVVFAAVTAILVALGLAGILPRTRRYHVPVGMTDLPEAAGE
ncbi:MAG: hypothetical protein EPN33_00430 [Acidobacteria bacterium]|nr:MAG: hypothetical protein EPN33_00430 [Acidobacteriota bacterium]